MTTETLASATESPPNSSVSPINAVQGGPLTFSPSIVARKARILAEWRDLIYREALRMSGALRQILVQSNHRSQITRTFLGQFNELLAGLRLPTGLSGLDSNLHGMSLDFEALLRPWINVFECEEITGPFIHSALLSMWSFLRAGLLTSEDSPLSRIFVHNLTFSIAHSRFETTLLETDEVVMLELIEFLAGLVRITVIGIKSLEYSTIEMGNSEIVGETFVFQLFDLLFVLMNQTRFSELLRARSVDLAVELCSLLFQCLECFDRFPEDFSDARNTAIAFPNIVKPEKPPIYNPAASRVTSPKQSNPDSESVLKVNEMGDSVVSISLADEYKPKDSDSPTASTALVTSSESSSGLGPNFNPFAEGADEEIAPDVVEEVMKYRAKIAGISLDSDEMAGEGNELESNDSNDGILMDRLSRHCILELFSFLLRCIDILENPGKKAPGSQTISTSTKAIPSIKTQSTALKCLLAIFSDPSSGLSSSRWQEQSTLLGSLFEHDLLELIGDGLLKHLIGILALDSSCRHLTTLNQLLLLIFSNFRPHFPAQFEYFLSTCLGLIASKPGSHSVSSASSSVSSSAASTANSGGAAVAPRNNSNGLGIPMPALNKSIPRPALIALKTTCLELVSYFLQDPSFIAQIFVFYECSLDFPNTLEQLTKGIAAGMEKASGNEEITTLSGEILCNLIRTIEASLSRVHPRREIENLKALLEQRRIKMLYKEAAYKFNFDYKEALGFLREKGLLSEEASPAEIAAFLRRAQGLDKKILGEYLVKPSNIEVLRAFFSAFRFSESTSIDSALRQVLESFRLPGEAQQIDRIMECFSEIYFPSSNGVFTSRDACYVLAFSTLMLNTDLHNPQVKHKMSLPDFVRNNRGINDGKDIEEEYLGRLYHSIKTREIVMPEEHGGEEAFSAQWNEVQRRSESFPRDFEDLRELVLSPLVHGIVEIVWKPIITSLIPYINQQRPTGEAIGAGPLDALRGIASLFEKFQMIDALEALLGNIWSVSNLIPVFSASSGNMIPRYLARLPGFRQVVQLIVDIFRGQGSGLQASWTNFCRLIIMLSESNLIPWDATLTQEILLFSGVRQVSLMQLIKMAQSGRRTLAPAKTSFYSSISGFFNSSNSAAAVATTGNLTPATTNVAVDETIMAARNFVSSSLPVVSVVVETIPRLESESSFVAAIEALCAHVKWNLTVDAASGRKLTAASTMGLNWTEETLILLAETLVSVGLACSESRLARLVLPRAQMALTRLALQQEGSIPPRLGVHATIGLGRLILKASGSSVETCKGALLTSYLKFWCQLSPELQGLTLEPFLAIVGLLMAGDGERVRVVESDLWPPLFTVLAAASKYDSSAPFIYKLLSIVPEIPLDFFSEYLDLLSGAVIASCTEANASVKLFDPWRDGVAAKPPASPEASEAAELPESVVIRGELAIEGIALYEQVFLSLEESSKDFSVTWNEYCVSLLTSLSRHSLHPIRAVRQNALNLLMRLLPRRPPSPTTSTIGTLFARVLFPLLIDLRLAKSSKPTGSTAALVDEVIVRVASLSCKTFLLGLNDERSSLKTVQLWKELLESLLPFLMTSTSTIASGPNSPGGEYLREAILEGCKNVLLVMQGEASLRAEPEIWRVTDVLLGPLAPNWRVEIEMRLGEHVAVGDNENEAAESRAVESKTAESKAVESKAEKTVESHAAPVKASQDHAPQEGILAEAKIPSASIPITFDV